MSYEDQHWRLNWRHSLVGENYSAEVGFVRRTGYKSIAPEINYEFYPPYSYISNHGPGIEYEALWDMSNKKLDETIDITFTKTLYFATLIQYNSQLDNININARFQWRYQPASDIYIVYTDNYYTDLSRSKNRALVFKITYWFNA